MLDVSRIQTGKLELRPEARDLCELMQEIVGRFSAQYEGEESPVSLQSCGTVLASVDPFRFEQVVANLLNNAVKYAPKTPILVSVEERGERVRITVTDQGPGIAPENLEKIFGRFERAISASEVSGLGLGLYISREIIEAHHGRIWAESERGKGAAFIIELSCLKL
jgi:signal transduction histidine kinase